MTPLPASNIALCELGLPELSSRALEQLTRICAFLYAVNRPGIVTSALLAGYTPEIHMGGYYRASVVSGDRSFGEWRQWRSLRPPRDPDLPDLVAKLDRFTERWRPWVMEAVAGVPDVGDRGELEDYLGEGIDRPSRTWRAKAWVARVEHLSKVPLPCYQAAWAALVAKGIEAELARFHEVLEAVQEFLLRAPLDAEELAEMHAAREDGAAAIKDWLSERRSQFAGHVTEETLVFLALGELAPPPLPKMPLCLLAHFGPEARA